jgi:hypothetical protein
VADVSDVCGVGKECVVEGYERVEKGGVETGGVVSKWK